MLLIRRMRDLLVTLRTAAALGQRECRHDGDGWLCDNCVRWSVGG